MNTELDEKYILDAAQDPHEQVWESDAVISEMQSADDPADEYGDGTKVPAFRNSTGELSFLNQLEEVADTFLSDDKPVPVPRAKLEAIRTRELGSDKWRGGMRVVTANMSGPIVTESSKRRTVKLVNHGPNVAYLCSINGGVANSPNTVPLLVVTATLYPEKEIATRDNIWAICAAGQTATVEVIELFDMES